MRAIFSIVRRAHFLFCTNLILVFFFHYSHRGPPRTSAALIADGGFFAVTRKTVKVLRVYAVTFYCGEYGIDLSILAIGTTHKKES